MLVQSQRIKIMCLHSAGDLKRCFHSGPCFFSFNEDVPIFFIFLEEHVVISRAFASPTFLINYEPNSASHDINVWWERVTTLVFLSLHFASVPPQKRLGPRAPPTKHFRAAMADFRREISGSGAPNSGDMNGTCKNWFFIRVFNCFLTSFRLFFCVVRQVIDLTMFSGRTKEQSGIPVCRQNLWHWETVVVD